MLSAIDINKRFSEIPALSAVTISFAEGKTTALIGPSGCGKSTLIRVLIGLLWPDSGQVLNDGVPITPQNVAEIRHRIGYVIQDGGLFPHLTGRENVTLQARYLGWTRKRIQDRLVALTELVHLTPTILDRYPSQLSGGQRQRVSLMRALMLDPDTLLLDEPFGALDPLIRHELQAELKETCRALKKTAILVTHDLNEAAFLADEIILMRQGSVVQSGSVRDFIDHPAQSFVSDFVNAYRNHWEHK